MNEKIIEARLETEMEKYIQERVETESQLIDNDGMIEFKDILLELDDPSVRNLRGND